MTSTYLLALVVSVLAASALTPLVLHYAIDKGLYDIPKDDRRVHTKPIPRVGGIAVTGAFIATLLIMMDFSDLSYSRPLVALIIATLIMFGIGIYDDIRGMNTWLKLIGQIVAAGVVLAGGLGIVSVTNPLGGVVMLDGWRIPFEFMGETYNILPVANLISIIWIVGVVNTVNFLDGLDGLAAGVSGIAAVVLFVLAISPGIGNPVVALLALILAGSLLGFLPYNFNPARIFLGDSGAYVIGLLLAVLSIYSGSKIAVGGFVLGMAIADSLWAVLRRLAKRKSPFAPDRGHLHHLLHDNGLGHRRTVLVLYLFAASLAAAVLLGGALWAALTLAALVVVTFCLVRYLSKNGQKAGNV